jgi:addiction module HigA family antidote
MSRLKSSIEVFMPRTAIHPGAHLADAIAGLGMTATQLARDLKVPPNRITAILQGRRAITADTALRLARYLDTSPTFWMNLQQLYDLRIAEETIRDVLTGIPQRKRTDVETIAPLPKDVAK